MKSKPVLNFFSATIIDYPEKDLDKLDDSNVVLTDRPKFSCKKCYGRGVTSRDSQNFFYYICSCVRKNIDQSYAISKKQNLDI